MKPRLMKTLGDGAQDGVLDPKLIWVRRTWVSYRDILTKQTQIQVCGHLHRLRHLWRIYCLELLFLFSVCGQYRRFAVHGGSFLFQYNSPPDLLLQSTLPSSLPPSLPPSLPTYLPPSLPLSLSFPPSFPPSLLLLLVLLLLGRSGVVISCKCCSCSCSLNFVIVSLRLGTTLCLQNCHA